MEILRNGKDSFVQHVCHVCIARDIAEAVWEEANPGAAVGETRMRDPFYGVGARTDSLDLLHFVHAE